MQAAVHVIVNLSSVIVLLLTEAFCCLCRYGVIAIEKIANRFQCDAGDALQRALQRGRDKESDGEESPRSPDRAAPSDGGTRPGDEEGQGRVAMSPSFVLRSSTISLLPRRAAALRHSRRTPHHDGAVRRRFGHRARAAEDPCEPTFQFPRHSLLLSL